MRKDIAVPFLEFADIIDHFLEILHAFGNGFTFGSDLAESGNFAFQQNLKTRNEPRSRLCVNIIYSIQLNICLYSNK